ncbi:MAG: winged helix DNA-binding protein [Bacteroides sp.]|nr:winged helix DNA-binding protein [Bacteroides sp.]
MRTKSLHPENSKTALNKKMYNTFENSLLARENMTMSSYINDISKRLKVLTLKMIERKTELSGISQCIRAILKSLSEKDGVTELELCRDIKYAAATVSVSLKKMAYDEVLRLVIDSKDRRQTLIYITDKGREIESYLDIAYKEIDRIMLKDITEEEKETVLPILKKMLKNVLEAQGDENAEKISAEAAEKPSAESKPKGRPRKSAADSAVKSTPKSAAKSTSKSTAKSAAKKSEVKTAEAATGKKRTRKNEK